MTTKTNTRPKPNTTVDERPSRTQKSKPDETEKTSTENAPEKTIKFEATAATHRAVRTPLLSHTTGRLMAIMRSRGAELPTESEQSFGINAFAGLKPRDTAEVLLCTQMVAVHEVAMAMLTGAKMATEIPSLQEQGNLAVKLLGMFERQFAALAKARRPQQVVEVQHTHRHVHIDGQPIPGAGVMTQIEGQPYGPNDPRALALAPGPALLGEDTPAADAMPVASNAERPLPNPRRPLARRAKR
jgi:hypothetical protein